MPGAGPVLDQFGRALSDAELGADPAALADAPPPVSGAKAAAFAEDSNKAGDKKADDSKSDGSAEPDPTKGPRVPFFSLFRFANPMERFVILPLAFLCSVLNGLTMPAFALIFREMIDALTTEDTDQVNEKMEDAALLFVYVGIATIFLSYGEAGLFAYTAETQTHRLRKLYLGAILRQDVGYFDTRKTGEIVTTVATDTVYFQKGIGAKLGAVIHHFSAFVGGFAIGFALGWQLALFMMGVVPLLALSGGMFAKFLADITENSQKAYITAGGIAEEAISSVRTVQSFAAEERHIADYDSNLTDAEKIGIKRGRTSGMAMGSVLLIMFFSYGGAFAFSAFLIREGEKSPLTDDPYTGADLVAVFFAVLIGAMELGQGGPLIPTVVSGQAAAHRMYEVIDRRPVIDSQSDAGTKLSGVRGKIEFRNVRFAYPSRPDAIIFRNMNFTMEAGKTVAFVGNTGAGKSSVINLIERFYDPLAGGVFLDGVNLRDINVKSLRDHVGLVSQEPTLFATTIGQNIAYGKDGVTQAEIEEAARIANAHDFITSLPDGYNTEVGERGVQLSGGQKQRVAIARAILKNPPVLLLDEATSALDTKSEAVVQDALNKAMTSRTTAIVAHRLTTVRHADVINVIKDGAIVESGTHDELMAKDNVYAELVRRQATTTDQAAAEKFAEEFEAGEDPEAVKITPAMRSKSLSMGKKDKSRNADADADADVPLTKAEKKAKKEQEKQASKERLGRLQKLAAPERGYIMSGALVSVLNGFLFPIFALLFSEFIQVFYEEDLDKQEEDSYVYMGYFFALGIAAMLLGWWQQELFSVAGERLTRRLRRMSFESILRKDIGFFDRTENTTGQLTTKLATDATLVSGLLVEVPLSVQNLGTIAFALGIAFYYGWELTLVVLCTIPVIGLGAYLQMAFFAGFAEASSNALEAAGQTVNQAVTGIRTVASFRLEGPILDQYVDHLLAPLEQAKKAAHSTGIGFGIGQSTMFLGYALAFWYGGRLIDEGEYSFGDVMNVAFAIIFSSFSLGQLSSILPDKEKATQATTSIFKVLDTPTLVDSLDESGMKPSRCDGKIEFRDVSFRYPSRPDAQIFRGLSLEVPAGKSAALVGPSGSGKSSVVSLLERFYLPETGTILVDGQDISGLNVHHLREHMGLVSQEPTLFDSSIRENIRYGRPGATQKEIEEAARIANAHDFIVALPDGYDTRVGEKGAQLSGGQKQRVAIARAVLKDPPILLLDEATSALDSKSEAVVQEALNKAMANRTTIMIAHRLSTIRDCDIIFVLRDGVVAEKGNHDELMAQGQFYAELVQRAS